MSHPIDQIDNPRTKPLQMEHDGQKNSGRSQSDVRLENCESRARRVLPNSLIASHHGPVTLLRLSCPAKRNALDDATIAGIESLFSDPPEQTRTIISCTARGSIFRPVSIFLPSRMPVRWPAFAFRDPGIVLSTGSRMAMCRSSLSSTAPSSVAAWSWPPEVA
jgi:hypothetical protein